MLTINIDPVAFHIGTTVVHWNTLTMGAGIIVCVLMVYAEAKRVGFPMNQFYIMALWMVPGPFIFTRLFYVLANLDYFVLHTGSIIGIESWSIYGAIFGGIVPIAIYCLVKRIPFGRTIDAFAMGAIAGMGTGRIGCLIDGCCHGLQTDSVFSVVYSNPASAAPLNVAIYPTQELYLVWDFIIFGILWRQRRRFHNGALTLLVIALYGAGDFMIRFTRDSERVWLGLQQVQVVSLVVFIVAGTWFALRAKRDVSMKKVASSARE